MNFRQLSGLLRQINDQLLIKAVRTVNTNLTIRNWLFGFYIVEYEQKGEDKAQYGEKLLSGLADEVKIKGLSAPELSRCRQFYQTYPEILGTLSQKFSHLIPPAIIGTVSQKSTDPDTSKKQEYSVKLVSSIPYSHFTELIKIPDEGKRKFYELLILKTMPSVRELRRQIYSLSYERLGLSARKEIAFQEMQRKIEPTVSTDLVKSHYLFEFLNLAGREMVEESDLEQALLDHLREFILELGNGFCFEARQKRILIVEEYFFVDLVFYHRILKCHVLIELKVDEFTHANVGQLNTFLNFYKREIIQPEDNPPVWILLVTDKNDALVQFATAGMTNRLFVTKYLVELPSKEQLESFIREEIKNIPV